MVERRRGRARMCSPLRRCTTADHNDVASGILSSQLDYDGPMPNFIYYLSGEGKGGRVGKKDEEIRREGKRGDREREFKKWQ